MLYLISSFRCTNRTIRALFINYFESSIQFLLESVDLHPLKKLNYFWEIIKCSLSYVLLFQNFPKWNFSPSTVSTGDYGKIGCNINLSDRSLLFFFFILTQWEFSWKDSCNPGGPIRSLERRGILGIISVYMFQVKQYISWYQCLNPLTLYL